MKRKRFALAHDHEGSTSNSVPYTGQQSPGQIKCRLSLLRSASCRNVNGHDQPDDVNHMDVQVTTTALDDQQFVSPVYVDLGDCVNVCEYCGSMFWFDERLLSSPLTILPKYTICCRKGRVVLPFPVDPPQVFKDLFSDLTFQANIRAYNSMFAMTSFGASIDDSVNSGSGPYVFKVAGQISHWLGSLCPPEGERPRFLQMYVCDTENEVSNRLHFFTGQDCSQLSADVVSVLCKILPEVNDYVRLFKSARELCERGNISDFAIRIHSRASHGFYGPPAFGTLGAIVCGDDSVAEQFDIIIRSKDNIPHRVSKLHPSYMPMQYPLLFPRGEQGWSPELQLTKDPRSNDRKLTMNMF